MTLATPCQAGPLFDWLFHRKPQTAAVAAPAYATAPASSCGTAQCQQTVVQYVPQVAYRTVWEPVPVTTYRRTVSYNPANGLPMTCTQPCTSYTYQARRVPYTTFRTVYATVPVSAPAPATYVAPAAVAPSVALPATPGCNCAAPAYGYQAPAQQPYYTTPAAPAGTTPWEPVNRTPLGSTVPPASAPIDSAPRSQDEADRIPRIDPNIRPQSGTSYYLPGITNSPNTNSPTTPPSSGTGPSTTTRGYRDEYYQRPTEWTPINPPASASAAPAPTTNQWRSDQPQPIPQLTAPGNSTTNGSSAPFALQPIPNLDGRSSSALPSENSRSTENRFPGPSLSPPDQNEAPPLINESRDRTALMQPIPTRWAANRIEWPEQQVQYEEEVGAQPPTRQAIYRTESDRRLDTRRSVAPPAPASTPSADDDGWRTTTPRSDGWRRS